MFSCQTSLSDMSAIIHCFATFCEAAMLAKVAKCFFWPTRAVLSRFGRRGAYRLRSRRIYIADGQRAVVQVSFQRAIDRRCGRDRPTPMKYSFVHYHNGWPISRGEEKNGTRMFADSADSRGLSSCLIRVDPFNPRSSASYSSFISTTPKANLL